MAANAIVGVSTGFTRELDIVGIGYRVDVKGRVAIFSLGWHVFLLTLGAIISALGVIVFEAPFKIAPGGISGERVSGGGEAL